jgi:EPS-associated MarR family transcriptional regulator
MSQNSLYKAIILFTVQLMNYNVQIMNNNKFKKDYFDVLRKIQNNPSTSQRAMASELGFSLGKLNYCLKALQSKGLVKINNFKKNPNKISYLYILTPKGIAAKTELTIMFMKRKMAEYDELKKEISKMNK